MANEEKSQELQKLDQLVLDALGLTANVYAYASFLLARIDFPNELQLEAFNRVMALGRASFDVMEQIHDLRNEVRGES